MEITAIAAAVKLTTLANTINQPIEQQFYVIRFAHTTLEIKTLLLDQEKQMILYLQKSEPIFTTLNNTQIK